MCTAIGFPCGSHRLRLLQTYCPRPDQTSYSIAVYLRQKRLGITDSTLDEFLSSSTEAELGASTYAPCSHVGFDYWSSQCGLEQNFQSGHRGGSFIPLFWDILSASLLCACLYQTFPGPVPALSIDPRLANVRECGISHAYRKVVKSGLTLIKVL